MLQTWSVTTPAKTQPTQSSRRMAKTTLRSGTTRIMERLGLQIWVKLLPLDFIQFFKRRCIFCRGILRADKKLQWARPWSKLQKELCCTNKAQTDEFVRAFRDHRMSSTPRIQCQTIESQAKDISDSSDVPTSCTPRNCEANFSVVWLKWCHVSLCLLTVQQLSFSAMFTNCFILSGCLKAFGVIYLELLDMYNAGEFVTSLASTMNTLTGVVYSKYISFSLYYSTLSNIDVFGEFKVWFLLSLVSKRDWDGHTEQGVQDHLQ